MSDNDKTTKPTAGDHLQGNNKDAAPTQVEQMVVLLEQIHPYERNPRHGTNPEYDRI